jgi:hypothetical protein
MNYLFLDTATKYTGYAVYEKSVLDPTLAFPVQYGLVKGGSKKVDERIVTLACKIEDLYGEVSPVGVVQEFPYFQAGSRGVSAARSGDTLQLARLCGHIEHSWLQMVIAAREMKMALPLMYNVQYNQWNGQLPKKVTCERCALAFDLMVDNPESIENNWVDAMMMGKWFFEKRLDMRTMRGEKPERKDY